MTTATAPPLLELASKIVVPKAGVYVVKGHGVPFHKVGNSGNFRRRLEVLGRGLPFGISLLGLIAEDDERRRVDIERKILAALKPWSTRGEWFSIKAKEEPAAAEQLRIAAEGRHFFTDEEIARLEWEASQ